MDSEGARLHKKQNLNYCPRPGLTTSTLSNTNHRKISASQTRPNIKKTRTKSIKRDGYYEHNANSLSHSQSYNAEQRTAAVSSRCVET